MKKINPNQVPFGIQNAVLAFALDLAGVPAAEQPCVNVYTTENLFAIGGGKKDANGKVTRPSRFNGMEIEEAAKAAFEAGEKGTVHYRFQRSNELGELCKAFSDQEAKVKSGETVDTTKTIQEIMDALAGGAMERGEAVVRLTCVILKTYITYKNQPLRVAPLVKKMNSGKSRNFDTTATITDAKGRTKVVPAKGVSSPGFRIESLKI